MAAGTATEPRSSAAAGRFGDWAGDDSPVAIRLHYVSLVVTFVVLAYLSRDQWFFNDDFIVLVLTQGRGTRGLFESFAAHWLLVPKLLAHLNFAVFGFRTYEPTLLIDLAVNTAVGHLLWRVMRQVGVAAWIATGLAAVYLVTPGSAVTQNILQAGWYGAAGLGLGAILCVNARDPDRRRDLGAVGLMIVALACHSGVALSMLVPVALVALLRRGLWAALAQAVPPIAVFAAWWLAIGNERTQAELPEGIPLPEVPRFVVTELSATVSDPTRLAEPLAVVMLVVVGGWLMVRWRQVSTSRAPAFAMAVGVVVLYFIAALRRPEVAYRYSYLAWLLFLPAVGVALHDLGRRPPVRSALGIGVSVVLGLVGLYYFTHVTHGETPTRRELRAMLIEAAARTETDGYVPEARFHEEYAPYVRARHIAQWQREGKFPRGAPSPAEWRIVAPLVQVRYTRTAPPTFKGGTRPVVEQVDGAVIDASSPRCVRLQPDGSPIRLRLSVPKLAAISVEGPRSVEVRLPEAAFDGELARSSHSVPRGKREYIELASDTRPVLVLPGREVATVCGVEAGSG